MHVVGAIEIIDDDDDDDKGYSNYARNVGGSSCISLKENIVLNEKNTAKLDRCSAAAVPVAFHPCFSEL